MEQQMVLASLPLHQPVWLYTGGAVNQLFSERRMRWMMLWNKWMRLWNDMKRGNWKVENAGGMKLRKLKKKKPRENRQKTRLCPPQYSPLLASPIFELVTRVGQTSGLTAYAEWNRGMSRTYQHFWTQNSTENTAEHRFFSSFPPTQIRHFYHLDNQTILL